MALNKSEVELIRQNAFESFAEKSVERTKDIGRISNSLNNNIARKKQLDLYEPLSEEQRLELVKSDKEHYVNRKGKNISLSVEDMVMVRAISSCIPFNDQKFKEYIEQFNNISKERKGCVKPNPSFPICIPELSKMIIGDTKKKSLKKITERLCRLAEIKQLQIFCINGHNVYKPNELIIIREPYFMDYKDIRSSKGRKKTETETFEDDKILLKADIIPSSLFLHEATNKYSPLYTQKYFEVCKRNKTELFQIILADLDSKVRQYYLNSLIAEKKAKEENKGLKNTDRKEYNRLIEEAIKKALIYKSSTLTIRDRVTTDYETNRVQRSRFIPDLQRAINSCIEYGIITDKSFISKGKDLVYFCFNPDFTGKEENYLQTLEEVKEE